MFLLDTNVVSELRKIESGRADPNVTNWAAGFTPQDFFISAITLMEIDIGVRKILRKDVTQGTMLSHWLDQKIIPLFADRILPIDAAVARRCAALHVPDKKSERDALIAATALVHDMSVVTRNEKDFGGTPSRIINPWKPAH